LIKISLLLDKEKGDQVTSTIIIRVDYSPTTGQETGRKATITDAATGVSLTYRKKLSLLQALEQGGDFPRPNWDSIAYSSSGLKKYWNSLSNGQRRIINAIELEQLLKELTTGSSERPTWQEAKNRVNRLVLKLFPNSNQAKQIRRNS